MAKSVEEQLSEVQEAISSVTQRGQRYTIKDRELWRADLNALEKRAERLEQKAAREDSGGIRVQRIVPL